MVEPCPDTSFAQLLHLHLRNHCGRVSRKFVRAQGQWIRELAPRLYLIMMTWVIYTVTISRTWLPKYDLLLWKEDSSGEQKIIQIWKRRSAERDFLSVKRISVDYIICFVSLKHTIIKSDLISICVFTDTICVSQQLMQRRGQEFKKEQSTIYGRSFRQKTKGYKI